MKRLVALSAAAGILLTGCAGISGQSTDRAAKGKNHPVGQSTAAASASAPAANPTFGQAFSFDDGLQVSVSAPEPFTPSDYAAVSGQPATFVSFTVTIVNGGQQNYDPALFSTSLQSGNTEADEVFDSAQGFEGSPSTPLLPGREVQFRIGYGVQNPADLVMQVQPGFEYDAAIFTS